jgi:hypothetical protein
MTSPTLGPQAPGPNQNEYRSNARDKRHVQDLEPDFFVGRERAFFVRPSKIPGPRFGQAAGQYKQHHQEVTDTAQRLAAQAMLRRGAN